MGATAFVSRGVDAGVTLIATRTAVASLGDSTVTALVSDGRVRLAGGSNGGVTSVSCRGTDTVASAEATRTKLSWSVRETVWFLSLIHISEPTRLLSISYAVFCLKK